MVRVDSDCKAELYLGDILKQCLKCVLGACEEAKVTRGSFDLGRHGAGGGGEQPLAFCPVRLPIPASANLERSSEDCFPELNVFHTPSGTLL